MEDRNQSYVGIEIHSYEPKGSKGMRDTGHPGCLYQFQRAGRNKSKIYFLFKYYIHPEDPLAKVVWSFENVKGKVHGKMR